jgi:hypothetical protein
MKSSQSSVVEQLRQTLNEHNLEALLAYFAPSFQGEQPLHPDRAGQTHLNSPENIHSVFDFPLRYMWRF